MRALVTGGAGFIGSHLTERLHSLGHDVLVVDSYASGTFRVPLLEKLGVGIEILDIRQERFRKVIEESKPEVIFHLAAQIDVRKSVEDPLHDAKVNIVGTLRLLEGARAAGSRVVFASSGGTIYGESEDEIPFAEDFVGRPTSPYGIGKKVAEDYLRFYRDAYGLPFVSLPLGNVYGPRQDPHGEAGVVAIFAGRLLRGERCLIYGDGEQTRDFVYVEDVVDAFVLAATKGEGETVNIASQKETSVNRLYELMARAFSTYDEPQYLPPREGELRRSSLQIDKAKRILGWSPATTLEEGLRRTIDWFRGEEGPA